MFWGAAHRSPAGRTGPAWARGAAGHPPTATDRQRTTPACVSAVWRVLTDHLFPRAAEVFVRISSTELLVHCAVLCGADGALRLRGGGGELAPGRPPRRGRRFGTGRSALGRRRRAGQNRRRDCHLTDTPSRSVWKHLLKGEGVWGKTRDANE